MKRSVLSGFLFASLALPLCLTGCGGGGVEEGMPQGIPDKPAVPIDSIKADMASEKAKLTAPKPSAAKSTTPPTEKKD
jgi:hypothetical protein